MVIASLRVQLRLRTEVSFWRKRRLIRSIMKQLHKHYNVSVAEVEALDHPTESVLLFAAVGLTKREVRTTLGKVLKAISTYRRTEITGQTLAEV